MDDVAYPQIPDYAFLSDCQSLALVGRDASVEWACFQRFDNSAVFARILDRERGGHFRIAPEGEFETTRRYLPNTNVLETTFRTPSGTVSVTDCLPVHEDPDNPGRTLRRRPDNLLVRMVRGVEGCVDMQVEFHPRFEYGLTTPALELVHEDLALVTGGPDVLVLQNGLGTLQPDAHGGATASATVQAGDEVFSALTYYEAGHHKARRLSRYDLRMRVDETVGFWSEWSARCRYNGKYRDAVVRSALVLKGLTHDSTGAVIAAATTSLPEEVGGERNWDYRFTWLRDSSALLVALGALGYRDEAQRFADWIWRTTAGRADELQIMYGIGGERMLHEATLHHLEGYRGSKPVRVGNAAWDQFQLDIFGEVVGALFFYAATATREQLAERPVDSRISFLRGLLDAVVDRWQEPDEGIWETRGGRQHFVFSKLMAWIALDYGVQLVGPISDSAEVERWAGTRDEIRSRIETEGVDPDTNAFTQAFGSTALDAASLQVGLRDFLPADDPRIVATVERIDKELTRNGHCYRYLDRSDGLAGGEGTFVFCTLWLVCALARIGKIDEAEARLEMVLGCASDLGLLAEELDPDTCEQLGNFPQAFSHIGVVAAAATIELVKGGWTGGLSQAATSVLFAEPEAR
ncbi:MAG: glycoside hydrolase family 15 protein [Acidimicrobiia bacterium]